MNGQISWILQLAVHEGRESDFRELMAEMVSAAKANEPGTLTYEWSTSADGSQCHVYERYADSDALIAHLKTFGSHYGARFMAALKPTGFVVYGAPTEEALVALAPLRPTYMQPAAGFNRDG